MTKRQKLIILSLVLIILLLLVSIVTFFIIKKNSLQDLSQDNTEIIKPETKLSHISIPVKIKQNTLNQLLEKYIDKNIILQDKGSKPVGLKKKILGKEIKINKKLHYEYDVNLQRGQIELQAENNTLELLVPLEGYANIRIAKSKPIKSLIKVKAGIKSIINIDSNGQLHSQSSPLIQIYQAEIPIKTGVKFIDKNLKSISIKSHLTKILKPILEKVVKEADKKIAKENLWNYLKNYWSNLRNDCIIPVKLQDGLNIYIKAEPQEFYYSGIDNQDNNLILSLGTKINLTVSSNVNQLLTECNIPKRPLIKKLNTPLNKLTLNLPLQLGYQSIEDILKQTLAKRTDNTNQIIFKDNIKLDIKDLNIYGKDQKLNIQLDVTTDLPKKIFDINSQLFFSGKPEFNTNNNTVSIKQFDFDIQSKNIFLKSAKPALYIFRDDFARSYMTFDLNKAIQKNKSKLNKSLENITITDGINAQLKINSWSIKSISAQNNYLLVNVLVNGQSTLSLDSIEVLK